MFYIKTGNNRCLSGFFNSHASPHPPKGPSTLTIDIKIFNEYFFSFMKIWIIQYRSPCMQHLNCTSLYILYWVYVFLLTTLEQYEHRSTYNTRKKRKFLYIPCKDSSILFLLLSSRRSHQVMCILYFKIETRCNVETRHNKL